MSDFYPLNSCTAIEFKKIIKTDKEKKISDRLSTRMSRGAAVIPNGEFLGWQMYVPTKGLVNMCIFGSEGINKDDLEWMSEKTAKLRKTDVSKNKKDISDLNELYELYLPIREQVGSKKIGFSIETSDDEGQIEKQEFGNSWPLKFSTQFIELVETLRVSGAFFRCVLGPASEEQGIECRNIFLKTANIRSVDVEEYIGKPIKTRFLLRLSGKPSVRLLTVLEEAISGTELRYLGNMSSKKISKIWDDPLKGGIVLPDYASRVLIMEPDAKKTVIGIEQCEEPVEKIPAEHENTKNKKAVVIGKALGTNGFERKITIGDLDLRRHYEIVGQTGTGKSTIIANMIVNAIESGYGLTFFDPHGSTIDVILRCVPSEYADRIRVVRIGDAENPVPLNIFDTDDIEKEERNINDLCELLADIFDPKREGIVGPRYERWFSTFCKASIAFLGRRASLESIAVFSQSKDNMLKLSKAIVKRYPTLVGTIKEEYGLDNSSDFQAVLNWYLSKFQRLLSVEQLRKTLGAGVDALDYKHTIDTDTVTLIDLASPTIGTHAARIIGSILLMKLWNAALTRSNRDMTHLVFVDEAALFQTNPMPRMLAESRKFGLGMVLSHQHESQLSVEIRDALEANSANFSAFRLSPRDAGLASVRLDDESLVNDLTRLDAFTAITTLSVDGKQTKPFTLEIEKPRFIRDAEINAAAIEKRSKEKLVDPYNEMRALSATELQQILNNAWQLSPEEYIKVMRVKKIAADNYAEKEANAAPEEKAAVPEPKPETTQKTVDEDKLPDWLIKWNDHYVSERGDSNGK